LDGFFRLPNRVVRGEGRQLAKKVMSLSRLYLIDIEPFAFSVVASPGACLFEVVCRAGIDLLAVCGGQGICGECSVIVLDGQVSRITEEETEFLTERHLRKGYRLACCTRIQGPVKIYIPDRTLASVPTGPIKMNRA